MMGELTIRLAMKQIDTVVTPRSSRNEVVPQDDGTYRVYVTVPPADGEANRRVITLVAKHFSVSRSSATIVRGHKGRKKTLVIEK